MYALLVGQPKTVIGQWGITSTYGYWADTGIPITRKWLTPYLQMVNTPTMFADSDSDSASRPKPSRTPIPKEPRKKARRRDFPSEQLVERNGDIDLTPALRPSELLDLEAVIESATPEQFQQLMSVCIRKMMVRGMKDIPPPKSIKELQVMVTLFRQMEGIEARDRGGGAPPAGFLPRTVSRKAIVDVEETIVDSEVMNTDSGDSLFPESESESEGEEKEFEI